LNRRTAEQGTAEYRDEKCCLFPKKTSAVRNSLFDPACGGIQNENPAGAGLNTAPSGTEDEGFKPGEWKNKKS